MKKFIITIVIICISSLLIIAFMNSKLLKLNEEIEFTANQTKLLMEEALIEGQNPRTIDKNKQIHWIKEKGFDWTEGFFPGTLWYLYELTKDESFKQGAIKTQNFFADDVRASSHDLGFIFISSNYRQYDEARVCPRKLLGKRSSLVIWFYHLLSLYKRRKIFIRCITYCRLYNK